MLEVGHFMSNNKGMTLIETLMAFSIFITIIVLVLSCYNSALNHHRHSHEEYLKYLQEQRIKESNLWQSDELQSSISEVLR